MNIKKNLDSKKVVLSKSIQKVMIMVLIAATILTATAGLTSCNKQGSAKSAEQLVDEIENYYAEKGNEFELQEISLTKVGDFHYGLFFSELKEDGLVLKSANYDISEKFYNKILKLAKSRPGIKINERDDLDYEYVTITLDAEAIKSNDNADILSYVFEEAKTNTTYYTWDETVGTGE